MIIGKGSLPRFGTRENKIELRLVNSSNDSDKRVSDQDDRADIGTPLPMIQRFIRLAQYSSVHHSISRRRISRPTTPPSASVSEGTGERNLDEELDSARLTSTDETRFNVLCAFTSLAAFDRLSRLPDPNLLQT